jgi:hypothetical protein
MTNNLSRCPHVATIGLIGTDDYLQAVQVCFFFKLKKMNQFIFPV